MKLSLADKIALIYSRDGSMRKTAASIGLTHQQVSRILHNQFEGKSNIFYDRSESISNSIDTAFAQLVQDSKEVAKHHQLPFSKDFPVFLTRLPLRKQAIRDSSGEKVFVGEPEEVSALLAGKKVIKQIRRHGKDVEKVYKLTKEQRQGARRITLLGDRVGAEHLHWLRDDLRNRWLLTQRKSGKYDHVSTGSVVNLPVYMQTARHRINTYLSQGGLTTPERLYAKAQLEKLNRAQAKDKIEKSKRTARVYTPYVTMDPAANPEVFIFNVNETIANRHSPAVGMPNTKLADSVLMQLKPVKQTAVRNEVTKSRSKKDVKGRAKR